MIDLISADVLEWAANYTGPKFHALLCDPPYHLHDGNPNAKGGFMGKQWDGGDIAFDPATWAALAEHLHPGGFIMAFASSRGWHRLACAIEDAGLRIHPSIFGWAQGSGFPKATRIDTQIDKAAGAKREGTGESRHRNVKPYDDSNGWNANNTTGNFEYTAPATPLAAVWEGHRYGGQALKPALEPIIVAQKPCAGRPVDSITATGAGALWVDGGRVATRDDCARPGPVLDIRGGRFGSGPKPRIDRPESENGNPAGRWPPNFVLTHVPPAPCPCAAYTPDGAPVAGCRECGGTGTRPGCERVGVRRVRTSSHSQGAARGQTIPKGAQGDVYSPFENTVNTSHVDADGLEAVAEFLCREECPVRRLGEQSGERAGAVSNGRAQNGAAFDVGSHAQRPGPSDTGTAARFFPNISWELNVAESADPVMRLRDDLPHDVRAAVLAELGCVADE